MCQAYISRAERVKLRRYIRRRGVARRRAVVFALSFRFRPACTAGYRVSFTGFRNTPTRNAVYRPRVNPRRVRRR